MVQDFFLTEKFFKICLLIRQNTCSRNNESLGNMCMGQSRVLNLLKAHPEISQKDLCDMLDIRAQSIGELLAKLEHNGYIVRTPSDTDHRAVNISLTPQGAAEADRLKTDRSDFAGLLDGMTDEEKETLNALLDKVIDGLKTRTAHCQEADGQHEKCPRCKQGRGAD